MGRSFYVTLPIVKVNQESEVTTERCFPISIIVWALAFHSTLAEFFFLLFSLTLFVVLQVTLMTTLSAVPCLKGPLPHYGFVQHPVALPPPSLLAVEQQELVKSAPVHLCGLSRHQARPLFSLHCDLVSFLQYRPPSTLFWKAREVRVLVSTLMILEVSVVK